MDRRRGRAEQVREDWWPDRAYGEQLAWWERLVRARVMPGDTVPTRRARVLGLLRTVLGFNIPDLQTALAPVFGQDAEDVEIVELPAELSDDFDTDDITTPPSSLWRGSAGDGTMSISSSDLSIGCTAGDDVRWLTMGGRPPHREIALSVLTGENADGASLFTEIITTVAPNNKTMIGHYWRDAGGNTVFIGMTDDGANQKLAWFEVIGGVPSALVQLHAPGNAFATAYLLTRFVTGSTFGWQVATTEAAITGTVAEIETNVENPLWCGLAAVCIENSKGACEGAFSTDFARLFEPNTPRGFTWLAVRDPGDPGSYDLAAAQVQIDKQGPAHAMGVVLTDRRGYLAGESPIEHPRYPTGA
jgi:hypothetical protein